MTLEQLQHSMVRVDAPSVHKVAYVCKKCGKTKKVGL